MSLTEEQEIFLQSLEKEFENRYTEMDEEFKAVLNAKPPTPPVCENYFERFDHRDRHEDNRAHGYSSSYKRNRFWSGGGGDDNYSTDRKKNYPNYYGNDFRDYEFRYKRERRYYNSPSRYESREGYSSRSPYESREVYSSRSPYESINNSHHH